jgi:hypothetical protein
MPLDKSTLSDAIEQAFQTARSTPPPTDPGATDGLQALILTRLASDLADAIDAFARSADVTGVAVQVRDAANNIIGTGTETGTGKLQ